MKNKITKIRTLLIGTIVATVLSIFLATNLAFAGPDPKAASPSNDLTNGTFSVTENLKLDNGEQPKKYFNKDNPNSPIVSLIITIIDYAITVMGAIAVILFIVAGFMFMFSQGNSQKLDEAKDIVKFAAIGLIVALLAYVITIFVQSIFSNG